MTWSELLFAHWPVDPAAVAQHLPEGLTLDTRDGKAWVGVVPFYMSDVAPRGLPAMPYLSRFAELNLRTYVTNDNKPGVWFFSLDAENPIAVRIARAAFNLPYMDAKMSLIKPSESKVSYTSCRTHRNEPKADFKGQYEPIGDPFRAADGTLEHWLTARYCLYSADRKGNLHRGEIDHPPWTLRAAQCEIEENSMGDAWNFCFNSDPHLLCAAPIKVRAWATTRCHKES